MQFPFFRKSEAFLAVGFRDHSVIWALEFLLKNHNSVKKKKTKNTFFGISFTARFLGVCMCVCVCVRERERERERGRETKTESEIKTGRKIFFPSQSMCKPGRIIFIKSIAIS